MLCVTNCIFKCFFFSFCEADKASLDHYMEVTESHPEAFLPHPSKSLQTLSLKYSMLPTEPCKLICQTYMLCEGR